MQSDCRAYHYDRYQLALVKNPRSIVLWQNYLGWLQKEICKSDPNYLKKEY